MKVQFLKDTATARIDAPAGTLVIYRDGFGYNPPPVPGAEYIEFLEYKKKYSMLDPSFIVMVGLNRIITPSNRCDMVNEYLQTMTPSTPKICLDTAPFIGEPWRLWFHYSVANCGKFNISYSYIIETEWEHWFYRDVPDCRLSPGNIGLLITDTISDLDPLTSEFDFYEIDQAEIDWYEQVKKSVINQHNTPKMFINNILKIANKRYGMTFGFDSYRESRPFSLPDLGIYRFVAEENVRRMGIFNEVISHENIS